MNKPKKSPAAGSNWQSALGPLENEDPAVFDRETPLEDPPTKPQPRLGRGWSAPPPKKGPKQADTNPPPTPRAPSSPRLSLDPEAPGNSPLDLAEMHAPERVLTAPPPMVAKRPSSPEVPSLADAHQQMQACYEVGDFSGALTAAERILELAPEDAEALRYAQSCRDVLTQMFSARLAPLGRTVSVAVSPEQIRWLSLDHKSGFLLSLIDGTSSIEEVLDISGMPRLDALRILLTLAQQKVIALT
ncbi:MAG TPA: hypothetical protein VL137_14205 [Polyangiaceae bacterium]|nr:hypothetical protein [Polyangiaceae bacterium]